MNIKTCIICNDDFIQKTNVQVTCSKECSKKNNYIVQRNNLHKHKKYNKECKECWNKFDTVSSIAKFCSRLCFYEDNKKSRVWKNNPAYKQGKHLWMIDFNKNCKLLDEKLISDKWYLYCEECNTTNTLRFEHHHLVYRSEKPKHEHIHNINNIMLLCIQCHNEFHKHKSKRNDIVQERELHLLFWNDILDK